MKTIVVTGPTGAIGRSLINLSIEAGYHVLAVVHRSSQRAGELGAIPGCSVLRLDLSEYDHAKEEMSCQGIDLNGYEMFFHLAWMSSFGSGRDDQELQLDNVRYALSAVRFANRLGCHTFVGAGSQAEYGRCDLPLSSETPANPETGYGIAKLCAGQMTRLLCAQLGMRHIWTRILSVYGPYDRDQTLISTAVSDMLAGRDTQFTPCEQMWDYLYSDDAAHVMLLAGEKGISGKVYVLGGGKVKPLRAYIEEIADLTGYRKEIGFGKRPYNDKQVMFLQADTKDLENDLGFVPQISFRDGISRILKWKRS